VTHTFESSGQKQFTDIDHYFVSKDNVDVIAISLEPLYDHRNFSDHVPILLSIEGVPNSMHFQATAGPTEGGGAVISISLIPQRH